MYGSECAEKITIEQVCKILSVSQASIKNWIRLGKITAEPDGKSFDKAYIEGLLNEIQNGSDSRLKSRRNKKGVNGKILYKAYAENRANIKAAENILAMCQNISDDELRIILAFFAVQLYRQSRGENICTDKHSLAVGNKVFDALTADLLGGIDTDSFDCTNIEPIFGLRLEFVPTEDTLGFIYISLRDLGQRKQAGAYYTPAKTVNRLIDSLISCFDGDINRKTFFDPCCATGNFLISLVEKGVPAECVYGQDIDKLSIMITRINMFLLNSSLTLDELYSHFICADTLTDTFSGKFTAVLGNPPWGYDYSREEAAALVTRYKTARVKGTESYDLFIEKGLDLLEDSGYMAYVLPEAVMNVASHKQARALIAEKVSFKFADYLGNAFYGVQCPAVIIGIKRDGRGEVKSCRVSHNNTKYVIERERGLDAQNFLLNLTDDEYDTLKAIDNAYNARYLAGNAEFALGIVTGNNREYIKSTKADGYETILRGSDIYRYGIKKCGSYIHYEPKSFQQAAPEELYRAQEKLFYRFICSLPVFAYDDKQTLSLNSCNILIPQIEGMSIKYILAVLNSSVSAYYISKRFNSVKLLRSHIEALPIPMISRAEQDNIVCKAELIMQDCEDPEALYRELDEDIFSVYNLTRQQRDIIKKSIDGKNLLLR